MKKPISIVLALAAVGLSMSCAALTAEAGTIKGDVTGDNNISLRDATVVQKIQAGIIEPTEQQRNSADFDMNGSVEVLDAFCIQKFVCLDGEMINLHSPLRSERIKFYDSLNADRAAAGLDPIEYNDAMLEAGNIRASEYVTKQSHQRPDGTQYYTVFGECNLAAATGVEPLEYEYTSAQPYGETAYNAIKRNYEGKSASEKESSTYGLMISNKCHNVCVGAAKDPNSNNYYWLIVVN